MVVKVVQTLVVVGPPLVCYGMFSGMLHRQSHALHIVNIQEGFGWSFLALFMAQS